MNVYQDLGVRRVINANAALTVLGGHLMPPEVLDAMREAAAWHIDMHEFAAAAGRDIARLTRNEAALVTSGASAAIVLAVLACRTRGDLHAIAQLPDGLPLRSSVIMHAAHRMPYDPAIALAGATVRQVGNVVQTFDWELEAAITDDTAAVLWVAGTHMAPGALDLPKTVEIAHMRGVPVVVDAASQLPPRENLWRFTEVEGADLALFSGGKELRGPQASGLLVGRRYLIAAAAENAAPHQRLARAMKTGKEEVAGLLTAVRLYMASDLHGASQRYERCIAGWQRQLSDLPGVAATRSFPHEAGQSIPRLRICLDEASAPVGATELAEKLWDEDPRVCVAVGPDNDVYLAPDVVAPCDETYVVDRLRAHLSPPACWPSAADGGPGRPATRARTEDSHEDSERHDGS